MSGLGRGAAADAIGGRSLANPMSHIRRPMAGRGAVGIPGMSRDARNVGTMMKMENVPSSAVASATGAAAMRNKTKMKMIDVNEVRELKKEEDERNMRMSEEEMKESKRRKIMEMAMAKGLKIKSMLENTQENAGNDKYKIE